MSPSDEKLWAVASHAGTLIAAWFAFGFLAPLVIWLVFRDRSIFVRHHAVESLNFQISLLIYGAIALVLTVVTFGIGAIVVVPLAIIAGIAALVVIIIATVAAADGRDYRYPLTIRLVR